MKTSLLYLAWGCALTLVSGCASPETSGGALIAVATNFAAAAEELETQFEANSAHEITLVTGATGQLYAQIINDAPYAALLSADQARAEKLQQDSRAVPGSRFTYARGALALWKPGATETSAQTVLHSDFRHVAIANPALAPYGLAAQDVIEHLGLTQTLEPKIVMGENIGQTFGLIATGNAELGFVAMSSLKRAAYDIPAAYWIVPQELYTPIFQDAILLRAGDGNAAASAFLDYLKTPAAQAVMQSYGYSHG